MDPRRLVVLPAGLRRCRPLLLPIFVAAALAHTPAAAQQAPAPADTPAPPAATSNPEAKKGDTVILTVTGTRRREPVRDVPVQLNTIPAEQLEQSGARTLTDYLTTQPGLDLKPSRGPGLA